MFALFGCALHDGLGVIRCVWSGGEHGGDGGGVRFVLTFLSLVGICVGLGHAVALGALVAAVGLSVR